MYRRNRPKLIAARKTGTRRIYGTDFPVETLVQRYASDEWAVLINLCNGTADSAETFATRREALDFAGLELGEGLE